MTLYSYTALKDDSITVTGKVEADSVAEARRKIRAMNLLPTSIVDDVPAIKKKMAFASGVGGKITALTLKEKRSEEHTSELQSR